MTYAPHVVFPSQVARETYHCLAAAGEREAAHVLAWARVTSSHDPDHPARGERDYLGHTGRLIGFIHEGRSALFERMAALWFAERWHGSQRDG